MCLYVKVCGGLTPAHSQAPISPLAHSHRTGWRENRMIVRRLVHPISEAMEQMQSLKYSFLYFFYVPVPQKTRGLEEATGTLRSLQQTVLPSAHLNNYRQLCNCDHLQ